MDKETSNNDQLKDLRDALSNEDALGIQLQVNSMLSQKLEAALKGIDESFSSETEISLEIQTAAKNYGGYDYEYEQGVAVVRLRAKQAAIQFADWLEQNSYVDDYELSILYRDGMGIERDAHDIDLDDIKDDTRFEFEFTVHIFPEFVSYIYDYYDQPKFEVEPGVSLEGESKDGEQITEVKRQIKVNSLGVKRIKMKCQRGFAYNSDSKTCEKITGQALSRKRKGARRAVLTKKGEGTSLKIRVKRKTKKAMRFRKNMGLK